MCDELHTRAIKMMKADAARNVEPAGVIGFAIVRADIAQVCVRIQNVSYLIKST